MSEELTTQETVDRLGYPTRQNLERWLRKDPRYGETFHHQVYSLETKVKAVELYLSGQYTAGQVAQTFLVGTVTTVMSWVHIVQRSGYDGLIPRRMSAAMPKPKPPQLPEDAEALRQRCEELELDNAILRETIDILKKTQASIPEA